MRANMTRALSEIWSILGAFVSSKFKEHIEKIGMKKIPIV